MSYVDNVIKYIPVVWPLQQFIATNPCWELIENSIEKVSDLLNQMGNIQTTLSLTEYRDLYQTNHIHDSAIHQAIQEFFNDPVDASLYQKIFYDFMTKEKYQDSISEQAILYSSQIQLYGYDNALVNIKEECLNWLSAYFNPSKFQKKLFITCFFDVWRTMYFEKDKHWKAILSNYSDDLNTFIQALLVELSIPEVSIQQYLFEICWQLKGWIGYIKWKQQYPHYPHDQQTVRIIEVIAMWLAYEVHWLKTHSHELRDFNPNYTVHTQDPRDDFIKKAWHNHITEINQTLSTQKVQHIEHLANTYPVSFQSFCWLWQRAYEISYHAPLNRSLLEKMSNTTQQRKCSKAQWVFCIDVRSEGFRRHLESVGEYETFGFAGFFGVAYRLKHKNKLTYQCPALIEPTLQVEMLNAENSLCENTTKTLKHSIHKTKEPLFSPFALYEILGFWFAFTLIFKNYAQNLFNTLKQLCTKRSKSTFNLKEFDQKTMVDISKTLLQGIGLIDDFSEFVIICGHSATTENNPYHSALDCGACGGNGGTSNAIIACKILNTKKVRLALVEAGITIPEHTVFIPACHDTTTDQIYWFETHTQLTDKQSKRLERIKKDAKQSGKQLQKERLQSLPGDKNVSSRSRHWAELIPEWGLANNAAMIIAPRTLTSELNLERRAFLHSYDPQHDADGKILESIFLGPVIVAHWINSQYYFSSVNPEQYGSGNKAIHNVLPSVGVMEGNQSDLQYGLPLQSVYYQNKRIHTPLRLCVFIDAKPEIINDIIDKHKVLKSLVNGRWLFVKSLRC